MDDAMAVRVIERLRDLNRVADRLAQRQRAAA